MRIGKLSNPWFHPKPYKTPSRKRKPVIKKPIAVIQRSPRDSEDYSYEALQIILSKKLAIMIAEGRFKGVVYDQYYTPPPLKIKRGIMDNIGEIFESNYDIPPSRRITTYREE